ncbi:MAG: class IV adenylate cyclase [Spirochaetes bacterium]|nr:class IV adenylate cyclase [Spirochaetota bacterium]
MIEVELKAWIDDPETVALRVASFANFVRSFEKADEYWHGSEWRLHRGQKGFRIRSDESRSIVTFKRKRTEAGIEINDEREFDVSDPAAFSEFALRIGCEPFYAKRKTGSAWDAQGVTIEITHVDGLGDFIEIERLVESDDSALIATAQGLIRTMLVRTGVPESSIEPRSYSELLVR